ncbi:hypothetical protein BDP27DRAFT_1364684 [Rhodocollybia butyracea]|uniref:Uncharacterized protein n=1 Tax=Rhodocollybia butyracea TaxID=206335 RepID=A0A9P5PSL2_9AGAR|nr:hypothetical protein BDP27DRAFT_1364684 [Rhodocollybia butyracea]
MRFFFVITALLLSVALAAPVDLDATERERPVRRDGQPIWDRPQGWTRQGRDVDVNDLERERPIRAVTDLLDGSGRPREERDVDVNDLEKREGRVGLAGDSSRPRPFRRDVDVNDLERERPVRARLMPLASGSNRRPHGRDVDVNDLERERPVRAVTDLLEGSGRPREERDVDADELEKRRGGGGNNGSPSLSGGRPDYQRQY